MDSSTAAGRPGRTPLRGRHLLAALLALASLAALAGLFLVSVPAAICLAGGILAAILVRLVPWRRMGAAIGRHKVWAGVGAVVFLVVIVIPIAVIGLLAIGGGGGSSGAPNPGGVTGSPAPGPPQTPFDGYDLVITPIDIGAGTFRLQGSVDFEPQPGVNYPSFVQKGYQRGKVPVQASVQVMSPAFLQRIATATGPRNLPAAVFHNPDGTTSSYDVCYATCPPTHVTLRDLPGGTFGEVKVSDAPVVRKAHFGGQTEDVSWTDSTGDDVEFSYTISPFGAVGSGLTGVLGQAARLGAYVWGLMGVLVSSIFQFALRDVYESLRNRLTSGRTAAH